MKSFVAVCVLMTIAMIQATTTTTDVVTPSKDAAQPQNPLAISDLVLDASVKSIRHLRIEDAPVASAATEVDEVKAEAIDAKPEAVDAKVETAEVKPEAVDAKVETAEVKPEAVDVKVETADVKTETTDAKFEAADVKTDTAVAPQKEWFGFGRIGCGLGCGGFGLGGLGGLGCGFGRFLC
jgi:hypothetical protein